MSAGTGVLDATALKVTQARVVRSEWTKLRSLRSTYWVLLILVVVSVGLAALVCAATASHWSQARPEERLTFDPTSRSLVGVFLAQLVVGVFGVLVVSGEYSTGTIRASLTAVPRRLPVLWAKVGVLVVASVLVCGACTAAAFTLGQAILSSQHIQASWGDPGVARAVLGATAYLTLVGVLALALGTMLRSTAASIATLVGVLLIAPIIVNFLPQSWQNDVTKYLPSSAGSSLMSVTHPDAGSLSPGWAFALLLGYAVIALAAAAALLTRRDA